MRVDHAVIYIQEAEHGPRNDAESLDTTYRSKNLQRMLKRRSNLHLPRQSYPGQRGTFANCRKGFTDDVVERGPQ